MLLGRITEAMASQFDISQVHSHARKLEQLARKENLTPQEVAQEVSDALKQLAELFRHENFEQQTQQRKPPFSR